MVLESYNLITESLNLARQGSNPIPQKLRESLSRAVDTAVNSRDTLIFGVKKSGEVVFYGVVRSGELVWSGAKVTGGLVLERSTNVLNGVSESTLNRVMGILEQISEFVQDPKGEIWNGANVYTKRVYAGLQYTLATVVETAEKTKIVFLDFRYFLYYSFSFKVMISLFFLFHRSSTLTMNLCIIIILYFINQNLNFILSKLF